MKHTITVTAGAGEFVVALEDSYMIGQSGNMEAWLNLTHFCTETHVCVLSCLHVKLVKEVLKLHIHIIWMHSRRGPFAIQVFDINGLIYLNV